MEPVVKENGDDEVGKAHTCKREPAEDPERPECHLELTIGVPGILERKNKAHHSDQKTQAGECSEHDEKKIIWQGRLLSLSTDR